MIQNFRIIEIQYKKISKKTKHRAENPIHQWAVQ